jgi:hypothetical protein
MQRRIPRFPEEEEAKISKFNRLRFRDAVTLETFLKPFITLNEENAPIDEYAKYFTALSMITHINPIKGEGDDLDLTVSDYNDTNKLWRQLQVQWDTSNCAHGKHEWFNNAEQLMTDIGELYTKLLEQREQITAKAEQKLHDDVK